MSTSYKSLFPNAPALPVEAFHYPEAASAVRSSEVATEAELFSSAEDEMTQAVMRAHSQGTREAEERERARHADQLAQERARVNQTIQHFQAQMAEYYSRMELEVVQLSLSIATKILHREVQADPLAMGRMVKAVLAKLPQNTKVRIRVRPEDIAGWQESLPAQAEAGMICEVVPDSTMEPGNCRLETELGTTEVGLAAQLKEIESGLFDLLAEGPAR
jgi:flagellar assembly protein FliH